MPALMAISGLLAALVAAAEVPADPIVDISHIDLSELADRPVDGVGAQQVYVGVYILAITSVDQAKGQFGIDAYLFLRSPDGTYSGSCAEADCTAQDSISRILVNGAAVDVTSINKFVSNRNTTTQFRVKGMFSATFDYRDWPFESLELQVAVEDPVRSNSSLQFLALDGFTALSPTVTAPGWNLHAAENDTAVLSRSSVVEYRREDASAAFSRMTIFIFLSRPSLSSFLKYLLPPSMILVMQLFALVITPDSVATRVSMAGSGLVSAVLFHTQLTAQTPPANYLLFSDRFMLGVYFVIMLNGLGSAVVINAKSTGFLVDSKRDALVWHSHWQSEAVAIVGVLGAATAVLLSWFDAASLPLQVIVGGVPPLAAIGVVSTAGAVLCHYAFGCHFVTPPEVLLEQARAALPPSHSDGGSPRRALTAPSRSTATTAEQHGPVSDGSEPAPHPEAKAAGASSRAVSSPSSRAVSSPSTPKGLSVAGHDSESQLLPSPSEAYESDLDAAWEAAAGRALRMQCCQPVLGRAMTIQHARRSRREQAAAEWTELSADDDTGPGDGILLTGRPAGGTLTNDGDSDQLID